eukprot:762036-Hanusia_phi.AAC.4
MTGPQKYARVQNGEFRVGTPLRDLQGVGYQHQGPGCSLALARRREEHEGTLLRPDLLPPPSSSSLFLLLLPIGPPVVTLACSSLLVALRAGSARLVGKILLHKQDNLDCSVVIKQTRMFNIYKKTLMIGVFTASFSFFIASSMAFQPILIQFNSVRCSTQFSKSAKPGVYKMRSSSENIPLASRQGIDRRSSLKRWSGIKLSGRRALFHGSVRSFESMKTTGQNLCALRNEKILWPAQKNPKNMLMYILKIFFRAGLVFLAMVAALAHHAMAHMVSAGASMHEATGVMPPLWKLCLLGGLIVTSACLAGAETAITTLWPWKVKKIAEEEGEKSPFKLLERDITKFLTAILIGTTTCTIYSAALAAEMAAQYGGDKMMTIVTIWLTVVTLVFGEIMPKALAVAQAERVARIMVPAINVIAMSLLQALYCSNDPRADHIKSGSQSHGRDGVRREQRERRRAEDDVRRLSSLIRTCVDD